MANLFETLFGKGANTLLGGLFLLIILYFVFVQIKAELAPAMDDLRLALTIIMFVWILNWMRNLLGSPRLALLLALVVSYLIFFKHPNILFTLFGMMILIYFIKPFYEKATDKGKPPIADLMGFYKDLAEKSKHSVIVVAPPTGYPAVIPIPMPQEKENKK